MTRPTRPLRPRPARAPGYPTFRQPARYRGALGALALAGGLALSTGAYADPPPPELQTRTAGIAPMPQITEVIPASGHLDLYLRDGGYAQVSVTLEGRTDLDTVTESDTFMSALTDHLSRLSCEELYGGPGHYAVREALAAAFPDGEPDVRRVDVTVAYCEGNIAPAGQASTIEVIPPVPGDVDLESSEHADEVEGPKLDCRIPRRDLE